ncbi:MAG: S8 family serine peptidase [Bdellovibrionota bacterium]|nr:S8 family serine peptidase [Bdellovibrionota bacterium]
MENIKKIILALALPLSAQAATVAIIDSGTDMLHQDIAPQAWVNPGEIARNDRDEDGNGYQDDIHGWNFAEGNSEVIDYSYLGTLTQDIRRFFGVQTDLMLGTVSEEDLAWARTMIQDEEFIKQISIYGNFMHGTHVGGIALKPTPESKLLAVKLIPTEVKLPGQESVKSMIAAKKNAGESQEGIGMWLLKQALGQLAKQQMLQLEEIAAYVGNHKADVANGSFGTGWPQARMIVETLGKTFMKDITEEQINEATKHFLNTLVAEGQNMVAAAPNTLFVFASGNDGLDNDQFPTSPTNIQADNVISVAATVERNAIAPFSNFGKKMVDVAAPGVGINSAVPGNQYLRVSGTSQAAPYIAGVASEIKETNPKLTPKEIKAIIMKTVDYKEFLRGKVVADGMVNSGRAVRAADLSQTHGLDQAIALARTEIADIPAMETKSVLGTPVEKGFVLPLPNSFILRK